MVNSKAENEQEGLAGRDISRMRNLHSREEEEERREWGTHQGQKACSHQHARLRDSIKGRDTEEQKSKKL